MLTTLWHTLVLVTSMWLVSVYGELKRLGGRTLCQTGLLSRAAASNSCRENIGLSNLSSDSTLYCKVAERRGILSFIYQWNSSLHTLSCWLILSQCPSIHRTRTFEFGYFSVSLSKELLISETKGRLWKAQTQYKKIEGLEMT
jgi:hypothetical protein